MKHVEFSDEDQLFPPLTIIFLLLLLILIGSILGVGLIFGQYYGQEQSFESLLSNLNAESSSGERNQIRWSILINHLTTFVIPSLLLAVLLYRRKWTAFLQIAHWPRGSYLGLGALFIVAALPLAQATYWFNKQLPLPAWALSMEDSTNAMINNLLVSAHPYELFFNLLVVAAIPAIGEELVFRGILQRQLQRLFNKPHLAIWLTALIFSAIHLQFEGFLPRMLLGAMLGYLLYWSKSLWVPILAHFVNNGLQIVAQYFYQKEMSQFNPDAVDDINWGFSLFSLILVAFLGYQLTKISQWKD